MVIFIFQFSQQNIISLVFNAFPCFHESVEYKHPLFETNGNNLTISLNQLKYAIFYGMNYLKYSLFGKQL